MADTFKGIITADGKKRQLPYRNVLETPVSDATLSVQGGFADAKVVGDNFKKAKAETDSLKEDLNIFLENKKIENTLKNDMLYLSNTARWFINNIFPKGAIINKISFIINNNTSEDDVTIELWNVKNESLELEAEISLGLLKKGTVNISLHKSLEWDTRISLKSNTSGLIGWDNSYGILTYSKDLQNTTIQKDNINSLKGTIISTVTYSIRKYNFKTVVTVGENCDYEEIQDAIDSVKEDSYNNPYTIVVFPKKIPYGRFSLIRDKENLENWNAYTWSNNNVPNISIIGLDKTKVIVKESRGEYEMPCCEALTNGIIKNISFIINHDKPISTPIKGGYAVHIDADTLNSQGYNMIFEDCNFSSDQAPAVGIGLHENANLIFNRCNFENTGDISYKPNSDYKNIANYGGVFCHSDKKADIQNQNITFDTCRGFTKYGSGLWLAKAGDYNGGMIVKAFGNAFNRIGTSGGKVNREDGIELQFTSFGNNSDALNA